MEHKWSSKRDRDLCARGIGGVGPIQFDGGLGAVRSTPPRPRPAENEQQSQKGNNKETSGVVSAPETDADEVRCFSQAPH
jgi:hypothetical protein